jgi:hypothetical protein
MMTIPPLCFPRDLLRFFYWLFFRPRTLERYLRQIDPKSSDRTPIFGLWRNNHQNESAKHLMWIVLFYLLAFPCLFTSFALVVFALCGVEVNLGWAAIGLAGGVVLGTMCTLVYGVADAALINLVFCIGTGIVGGVASDAGVSETINIAAGVAGGMIFGLIWDEEWGVAGGLAWGLGLGVVMGVSNNVWVGLVCGLAFGVTYFRPLFYGIEALWSLYLARFRPEAFHLSPVLWDELIWLPLPGLDRQLVALTQKDRKQGLEAIAQVWASFRQGWAARAATLELLSTSIASGRTPQQILHTVEMVFLLPNSLRIEFKELLSGLEQIGRYVRSAQQEETPAECLALLRSGHALTYRLRSLASVRNSRIPRPFEPALIAWEAVFEHEMEKILIPEHLPENGASSP